MVVESGDNEELGMAAKQQDVSGIGGDIVTHEIPAHTLRSEHGILVESVESDLPEHYTVQQVDADGHIQHIMVDGDTIEEVRRMHWWFMRNISLSKNCVNASNAFVL